MKQGLLILIMLLLAAGAVSADNCLSCHRDFEDDDGPSHKFVRDVHGQKGLGCADCHGGDPTLDDMDEVRALQTYRGVPDHLGVPEFCARCHSDAAYMHEHNPSLPVDQLDKYRTSVHGRRLFNNRDGKVANCVSCHSVHEIGTADMPYSSTHPANLPFVCGSCHADPDYMADYNIPTSQLDDYRQSVHGVALLERGDRGAPACNDCHGNHGAAPPGISSLSMVCGGCHALEAQLYNGSPHRVAFEDNDLPMCETCHSNHKIIKPSDQMVGADEPGLCSDCHSRDDGTIGSVTADSISVFIGRLVEGSGQARQVLAEAAEKGMHTTDLDFLMKEVDQALIETRTLVHGFDSGPVGEKAAGGIARADTVRVRSAALIDEYYFRRKGLGVATLIITLLAIGLFLKIRSLDK